MRALRLAIAMLLALAVPPAHAQVWIWSQNATLNGNIDPTINWVEGMAPSSVDDSARSTLAGVAKWRDDSSGLVALGGTSTAYTAATNQGNQGGLASSLVAGFRVCFSPNVVNSTPVTLQVDGQTVKPLRKAPGVELLGGEMQIGSPYCATFFTSNGGEFVLNDYYNVIIGASAVGTTQIANNAVTFAKMQAIANQTIMGNDSGSSHVPQQLTLGQGLGFSGTTVLVPNGAIASALIANGAVGTTQLATGAVAYANIQNESNATILGNDSGGAAAPQELTLGQGLGFSGTSVIVPNLGITTGLIGAHNVTYPKIQSVTASKLLGNPTGSTANVSEISLGATGALFFTGSTVEMQVVNNATGYSGGTSGQCLFNSSSIVVTAACARLDLADQVITGGANVTTQGLTTGNITVDCGSRPLQAIANNGNFTITAPSNDGSCVIDVGNTGSAGTVSFSGFNVGANTGDAFDTVNTHQFFVTIVRVNGFSTYMVKALQ